MQDIGAGMPQGGRRGIELIDILFAFSNIRLVREIIEDNIKQLQTADISKGQTEGLKNMILQKQETLLKDLGNVENLLGTIINNYMSPGVNVRSMGEVNLNPNESRAFVSAVLFSINHMAKFVPTAGGGGTGLPESMI